MTSALHELVYVSASRKDFSDADLHQLLAAARRSNTRAGLTGLLLYERGSFLQVLEGPKSQLDSLYERLRHDPRHHGLVRVHEAPIEARRFADWSMGFAAVTSGEAAELPGYNDFFLRETEELPRPDMVLRLLNAFRAGRWHACVRNG